MTSPNPARKRKMKDTKAAYKLCWRCNRRFRGSFKTLLKENGYEVYVHSQCAVKDAE